MTLQEYMRIFRAQWFAILVFMVVGGALAFGWCEVQEKVWTAASSVIVTADSTATEGSTVVGKDAESNVKSYVDIAKSRTVAARAGELIGSDESADELLDRVSIANPSDTAVIRFYAHAPTAEEARDLANAWVIASTEVVAQIEDSRTAAGAAPAAVGLMPLDTAALPDVPTSPNVKLTVALGLIAGLVIGIVFAVVRSTQDRKLRTPDEVEQLFEVPVVGALPFDPTIAKLGISAGADDYAMKEAVRQLRTNLQFVDVDHPPRVIVVTSALPGDGKSTTAAMLAEAVAEGGRRVVLIDADLRRPAVAANLGLATSVGLTDVLVGQVTLDEVIQHYGPTGKLDVLASGSIPPNPSELLASDAMHALLYSFPEDTMVIVDSPPLLPVTDAAVLTARTDGALVVARAGRTTIDELGQAIRDLERVKGRAIGVILDAVPLRGAHGAGYRGAYVYASKEGPVKEIAAEPHAAKVDASEPEAAAPEEPSAEADAEIVDEETVDVAAEDEGVVEAADEEPAEDDAAVAEAEAEVEVEVDDDAQATAATDATDDAVVPSEDEELEPIAVPDVDDEAESDEVTDEDADDEKPAAIALLHGDDEADAVADEVEADDESEAAPVGKESEPEEPEPEDEASAEAESPDDDVAVELVDEDESEVEDVADAEDADEVEADDSDELEDLDVPELEPDAEELELELVFAESAEEESEDLADEDEPTDAEGDEDDEDREVVPAAAGSGRKGGVIDPSEAG
ncbi:polysaccharide biosynthesis tyrosine autokinase [Demequina maris]|uniref:polysaccharide biosynthesis tyrosine autokinase n=1 Tax=Demequina maris TaxID=1638982 RepID=UPI0012E0C1AD|nr:polysaccharide biosynthesis tyrosine autokinase [Demequina maris]